AIKVPEALPRVIVEWRRLYRIAVHDVMKLWRNSRDAQEFVNPADGACGVLEEVFSPEDVDIVRSEAFDPELHRLPVNAGLQHPTGRRRRRGCRRKQIKRQIDV